MDKEGFHYEEIEGAFIITPPKDYIKKAWNRQYWEDRRFNAKIKEGKKILEELKEGDYLLERLMGK